MLKIRTERIDLKPGNIVIINCGLEKYCKKWPGWIGCALVTS